MQANEFHPVNDPNVPRTRGLFARRTRIGELVETVIGRNASAIAQARIKVELDLVPLEMTVFPNLLEDGIEALVKNAVDAMPQGGELSITLIQHDHHWELEVADTVNPVTERTSPVETARFDGSEDGLPVLLPFPSNINLRQAFDIAAHHGGQLQSWNCPRGGTAYVLVIPDRERIGQTMEKNGS